MIVIALYNRFVYGGFFTTGYDLAGIGLDWMLNSARLRFTETITFYSVSLTLIYPLMWLGLIIYKGRYRIELVTSCIIYIIFLLIYDNMATGITIRNLVVSSRYLLLIMPLFLIPYFSVLDKILTKLRISKIVFISGTFILLTVSSIYGQRSHSNYLKKFLKIKDTIYQATTDRSVIICNPGISAYIQSVWGKREIIYTFKDFRIDADKALREGKDIFYMGFEFPREDKDIWSELHRSVVETLYQVYNAQVIVKLADLWNMQILKLSLRQD